MAIGYGGDALVSSATGLARETIRNGRREITRGEEPTGRIRAPGAGRPGIEQDQPGIMAALEALVDPLTRGGPDLAVALDVQESREADRGADRAGLARQFDYRGAGCCTVWAIGCRSVRKRREGATHPDRNAQFEHINATADRLLTAGEPVISVDTKKKELVGNFANRGPGMAAEGDAGGGAGARLPERCGGQSDTLRRLRHGAQRSVGERCTRPRHARLCGGLDSPLVAQDGPAGLPAGDDAVHHGRFGRQQRVSVSRLEAGTSALCRSDPADHRGESFPTRDEQVEQDRAPALLPQSRRTGAARR